MGITQYKTTVLAFAQTVAGTDAARLKQPSILCLAVVLLALISMGLPTAPLQAEDQPSRSNLKVQAADLVRLLDASRSSLRQKAQDDLIELGPAVLQFLPTEGTSGLSAEQSRRLALVRGALVQKTTLASAAPSTVTLRAGNITLSDAVAEIQRQTGNQIVDLRDQFGQVVTNPEIAVQWKSTPFWKVMDELASKSQVGYYLYTGEPYLGLVAGPMPMTPVAYAGPMRAAVKKLVRSITYETGSSECALQLEVAWEPRLRPILLELDPAGIEAIDDQGRKIASETPPSRPAQGDEPPLVKVPVDKTMIRADLVLHFEPPPHDATRIKSLRGRLVVILPAGIQNFQFADLAGARNVSKSKSNLTVTLEEFKEFGEGQWAADLVLEFDAGQRDAFESYQTWFYDNEIYLQKADGTRFACNGGTTLKESGAGRLGIQYRFVDAPGRISDYSLVYKSPSTIVKQSLTFEFQDLKLP